MDILNDGIKAFRSATAELIDGAPRSLSSADLSDQANALHDELDRRFPGAVIRLRETGRLIRAEVIGVDPPDDRIDLDEIWPGDDDCAWRLTQISFTRGEEKRTLPRD